MARSTLALSLLAIALAAPGLRAQTTPATPAQPAANAVDPAVVQALAAMGVHLQTLRRFHVSTQLTAERVLADGQKLQHTAAADLSVERPNKLRADMTSARSRRALIYDGKTVSLYTPAQKYYSTVAFDEPLAVLVKRMQDEYAVEVPLSDLFVWGTPDAPFDRIESAMNAGQDYIHGDLCDHYAFRQGKLDWQIWIMSGGKPLPRKIVITNRSDDERPQSISILDWNLKPSFTGAVFKLVPPKGAAGVEIVPRKTS